MTVIRGLVDLSGYHVWWVVTDSDLVPFQGPNAELAALEYMKVHS